MQIEDAVVLVTGANRGIGAEFVRQLLDRGAAKVYAGVRDVGSVAGTAGVERLALDVLDDEQVAAAAAHATDVQIVINNAGIVTVQQLVGGDPARVHLEFETNVFGLLRVSCAFAPLLAANGGGAILNVLSASSWISVPGTASYCATKAAGWSLTDGLRFELAGQGTQVVALHVGPVDTDMGAQVESDLVKAAPADGVRRALDGLEAGAAEVLADDITRQVKSTLTADPARRYATFTARIDT
jgi:NAD(P)-dependent dehydrogenase (short-subunit alcohol dehydrogenase family)